jgi:predicted ArsR family transcriptional regulator
MSIELTPEQEESVQERIKEREKQVQEQWLDICETELAKVLRIMRERFGQEACEALVKANSEGVMQEWRKKAEDNGDNSIKSLIKLLWEPLTSHGFEYTMEETESRYQFNVTKCPGADIALRLGIGEQMYYFRCANDPFIAEGFNSNIGFTMTKTLMQGHDCCNHFYYYKNKDK